MEIKKDILNLPGTDFRQPAEVFYHKVEMPNRPPRYHQVDFIERDKVRPFVAESLIDCFPALYANVSHSVALSPVRSSARARHCRGEVPYISCEDLVVFKVHCCGLRGSRSKAETDAKDARDLLETMTRPLALSPQQQSVVNGGIDSVVEHCSEKPLSWWEEILGLPGHGTGNGEWEANGEGNHEEDNGEDDEGEDDEEEAEQGGKEGGWDGDEEDREEDGEEDDTFVYSSSSIRLSLFGFVFLAIERVKMAGVAH
jgi:hypothetical protein